MHDLERSIRRHPSAVLLVSQLGAVLLYPFLDESAVGRAFLGVVSMTVVGLALVAVRSTPALFVFAAALGAPALGLTVAEAFLPDSETVLLLSALFHAPFYFYVSYGLIKYLFQDDLVTRDEFFAIGAAFTVVAWGFTYLYAAVEVFWPGSFAGLHTDQDTWFELLFLSFTTLTNTGLSDIVPVLGHARSLVIIEEVVGIFYVALVVSRLVGLTIQRRASRQRGPS